MARLLERRAELEELRRTLLATDGGEGAVAVVLAEPGLGKTRLLDAAAAIAEERGLRVLRARGAELESTFPFGVVRQLLEPAVVDERVFAGPAAAARPLVVGEPGEERTRFAALHGLYWLVANLSDERPLALLIDDAHWGDRASLEFAGYLARRLAGMPVVLVLAARTGEPSGVERELLELERGAGAVVVRPRPLSRAGVAALLEARLGERPSEELAARCLDVTAGNPLFVVELARELEAGAEAPERLAPASVARLTLGRLEAFGADAVELARAAAVLGDGAEPAHAAALAGIGEDVAREVADGLVRAGVLAPERSLRFAHPVVRAAIHDDIPPRERADRHAAAAALLAEAGAAPERVAAHLLEAEPAGRPERVETLRAAAARAQAAGVRESAAAYLQRALDEPPAAGERPAVLVELGVAESRLQNLAEAEAHLTEALATGSAGTRVVAARRLAALHLTMARAGDALAVLRAERERLGDEDAELALELDAEIMTAAPLARGGIEVLQATLDRFATLAAGRPRFEALERLHRAYAELRMGAPAAAVAALAESALDSVDDVDTSFQWAVLTLVLAERYDTVDRAVDGALEQARRRGPTAITPLLIGSRALASFERGRLHAALADVELGLDALGGAEGSHISFPLFHAVRADALREQGRLLEAEAGLERAGLARGGPPMLPLVWLYLARARLHLAAGRAADARDDVVLVRESMELFGCGGVANADWRSVAAIVHAALGEDEVAQELAGRQLELARAYGAPGVLGGALRAAAAVAPDDDERLALLDEAVATLERSPARLDLAHALADRGTALRALGRRRESREPLREALAIADECGAALLAERARGELTAGGGRPPRFETSGLAALTPAERRTAELAASGLSNREVAQALFVTEKTVEMHLSRAYRKLGIRSRWQLAEHRLGSPR